MTTGADPDEREQDTLLAVERWLAVQDEVVRGVAHAMSNRVATISAGLWMLGETGAAPATSLAALHAEVDRLEQLLVQLRLLPRETAAAEPLLAADSARAAVALHEHHGELRNVPCVIDDPGSVPPARAIPQALLHALLVALNAAKQAALVGDTAILRLRGEDDVVRFIATVASASESPDAGDGRFELEARAADRLLQGSGGRARAHATGVIVEVPTLAATRRSRT